MDILLVDDDQVCLTALSLMLKKNGATVHKTKSAKAAKALIATQQFDIIFTDIGLPDVEYLCQLEPRPHIVVISGHILEEATQTLKKLGVMQLLEKPIYASQIQGIIDTISP